MPSRNGLKSVLRIGLLLLQDFSNHWKRVFQWLEKPARNVPMVGNRAFWFRETGGIRL